jgi:predicted nucleic acid-binding protein
VTETAGLLDTSVIVALESLRPIDEDRLPDRQYISVITVAELRAGVLAAAGTETLARRIRSLSAYSAVPALPADEASAEHWARLRYRLFETGRRVNVNDLWIAAIALANDLPVVTQDHDFDTLEAIGGPQIIHV